MGGVRRQTPLRTPVCGASAQCLARDCCCLNYFFTQRPPGGPVCSLRGARGSSSRGQGPGNFTCGREKTLARLGVTSGVDVNSHARVVSVLECGTAVGRLLMSPAASGAWVTRGYSLLCLSQRLEPVVPGSALQNACHGAGEENERNVESGEEGNSLTA